VAVGALELGICSLGAGLSFLQHLRDTVASASLKGSVLSCHQSPCVDFLDSVLASCATLPGCEQATFTGAARALSEETCSRLLHDSCDRDLVASMRALASCFIRADATALSAWLPSSVSIVDYCHIVDSMGTDAEGLVIRALAEALSIRLCIVYLHRDRAVGYYSYPVDNDDPCHVHLILAPGHYDLLYPALPPAWVSAVSLPGPVDAGVAAVPAPRALRWTGESLVQVRTPRTCRSPLPTGVSRSQSVLSSCPMHGIQVGTSVIHNWVSVAHSVNSLFCALLYGMLLQEVPVSAALRRVEERCLGYSPSEYPNESDSTMSWVGGQVMPVFSWLIFAPWKNSQ
jgi:hypothetical protein